MKFDKMEQSAEKKASAFGSWVKCEEDSQYLFPSNKQIFKTETWKDIVWIIHLIIYIRLFKVVVLALCCGSDCHRNIISSVKYSCFFKYAHNWSPWKHISSIKQSWLKYPHNYSTFAAYMQNNWFGVSGSTRLGSIEPASFPSAPSSHLCISSSLSLLIYLVCPPHTFSSSIMRWDWAKQMSLIREM